jgi:sec-independent protein translocase protein TatB
MFDASLSELMVIGVVALVVIGPERLPKVARTTGLILGRLQRYVSDVKADINREIQLDELKRLQQQVSDQVTSLEATVTHEMREVESTVDNVIAPPATDIAVASPQSGIPGTQSASAPTIESAPTVDVQAAPAPSAVVAETQKS